MNDFYFLQNDAHLRIVIPDINQVPCWEIAIDIDSVLHLQILLMVLILILIMTPNKLLSALLLCRLRRPNRLRLAPHQT
jgi:hypothetical protein